MHDMHTHLRTDAHTTTNSHFRHTFQLEPISSTIRLYLLLLIAVNTFAAKQLLNPVVQIKLDSSRSAGKHILQLPRIRIQIKQFVLQGSQQMVPIILANELGILCILQSHRSRWIDDADGAEGVVGRVLQMLIPGG